MALKLSRLLTNACCTPPAKRADGGGARIAGLCKALADPTRVEILELLAHSGEPLCACHLESHFSLSQPTVSHHLRLLREAGLIRGERAGTWVYYQLERAALAPLLGFLQRLAGP
ncbi:MAG: winged helix-turn-helix transcriptional regulator [Deltaproteobacteria bacterium]|nr:winged helix-turn-helix transcriptional regulator [Deltaproteobacteria bacterium]